jgi:thioredoxin reductase (NADPH)
MRRGRITSAILLAIGRRGTPRKLGVAGEDLSKVVYRLVEPDQYRGKNVLVVGGGDSALEAGATLSGETDAAVTLAYRGKAFARAKPKNRERIDSAVAAGRICVLLNTDVRRIEADTVVLDSEGREKALPNDAVLVSAGGILPTNFLRSVGVEIQTKYGTA